MSVVYEVKIITQAQEQMAEIVDYISNELCVPDAANNLLKEMESSIMSLSEFPERYQLIDEEPWRTEGVRKLLVNNFLIYYWIDKDKKKVQVIAVIYEKRNQIAQLKKVIKDM
jgi:addiction module RelE/StbE family toxin